jgi:DNA-binding transcriptional LysR family regulator
MILAIHMSDIAQLDLNLLLALEVLLVEQNVTRAAVRLGLSQPAVSTQLARLRVAFADPLLLPGTRGMTPTARALDLLEPLRTALDAVRDLLAGSRAFDPARDVHTFAIAASDYVQHAVLMPFVIALRRDAPRIRLALRNIDGAAVEKQLETGVIDLALMTPATAPPSLRSRPLWDERYVCIARRGHPKVRNKISLAQFETLEQVVVSPRGGGFTTPTDAALAARGRSRRVVLSVAHFTMLLALVERSDLVALAPERLVQGWAERLTIVPPPFAVPGFTIGMLWHDRAHGHAPHGWLRERVAAFAAGQDNRPARAGSSTTRGASRRMT